MQESFKPSESDETGKEDGISDSITKVLIVDDNFFNMFAITSIFEQYSIDADTATDGVDAIDMVRKLF